MSSMLVDKAKRSDEASLAAALGRAKAHWDATIEYLDREHAGLGREWRHYGAKHGWQLKVFSKKRAVLYLIPHHGSFLAGLALNKEAVEAARGSDLPPDLVREIMDAKPYTEGWPARIEVSRKQHVASVKQLIAIKLKWQ